MYAIRSYYVESYRDLLSFSRLENETIRLEKQHFSLLNQNIQGLSSDFRDNMLSLVEIDSSPESPPEQIQAKLRPYQLEGYSYNFV